MDTERIIYSDVHNKQLHIIHTSYEHTEDDQNVEAQMAFQTKKNPPSRMLAWIDGALLQNVCFENIYTDMQTFHQDSLPD